jgi:hypothetical protein
LNFFVYFIIYYSFINYLFSFYNNAIFFVDKEQNDQNDSIVIVNQFKLQDLQLNSNEKILDIIELILGQDWEQRIHKAAAISHVLVNLAEAKIDAIYAPFYCSLCNTLLGDKDAMLKHARTFHPHLVKKSDIGEPSELKLRNAVLKKFSASRFGNRTMAAISTDDEYARALLENDIEHATLRQPEAPRQRVRVNLSRHPYFDDIVDQLVEQNRQENLQL